VIAHRPGALERVALLLQDWNRAHRRLADTEQRTTAVLDELGLTELATSITGLSAIGGAAILAETGDPCRFATARALDWHAGPAPREKLSGTFTERTKLTGQGRPGLRLAAWRAVWGAQRQPGLPGPLPAPDQQREEQAQAHAGADRDRSGDPASPARRHHHRPDLGPGHRHPRQTPPGSARRRLNSEQCDQADGRGEPFAALRNFGYLDAHHGQPRPSSHQPDYTLMGPNPSTAMQGQTTDAAPANGLTSNVLR
jgi:hypothetical protein